MKGSNGFVQKCMYSVPFRRQVAFQPLNSTSVCCLHYLLNIQPEIEDRSGTRVNAFIRKRPIQRSCVSIKIEQFI